MSISIQRPLGVTILGILTVISGIILIVLGVFLIVIDIPLLTLDLPPDVASDIDKEALKVFTEGFFIYDVIGSILIALGAGLGLAIGFGILKGKGWARTITVILSFLSIALGLLSVPFTFIDESTNILTDALTMIVSLTVSLIIDVVVLYYLYRPHVKIFFAKMTSSSSSTTATTS